MQKVRIQTYIDCGGSGHVSKVCPKKGAVTKNPNQTSNESVRKNPGMSKEYVKRIYQKNHPRFHLNNFIVYAQEFSN